MKTHSSRGNIPNQVLFTHEAVNRGLNLLGFFFVFFNDLKSFVWIIDHGNTGALVTNDLSQA